MKTKPKVGQILYSLNIGNAARGCEKKLTKVVVKKVGRKYFTAGKVDCPKHMDNQYNLSDWREKSEYSPTSKLYVHPNSWEQEKEERVLCKKIYHGFEYGDNKLWLSLEDLRKINDILDKSENDNR